MNMKRSLRHLALIPVIVLLLTLVGNPILAQSYSFAVPQMQMQVYVQPDASVRIVYDITFENHGDPIDVVDIGTPHDNYDIGNMSASIDGEPLTDIRTSEYIDTGVEVHLDGQEIGRGEQGTLHFEFTMPDMVYQDTTDKEKASLQITPTWFDSDLVRGTTHLQLAIHIPEGVEPDEVVYQKEEFTNKALFNDRVVALWEWPETKITREHLVGVSFPKRVMQNVITMNIFQLTNKWLTDNPMVYLMLGAFNIALLSFLFFRFTGGTGCTVYVLLLGGAVFLFFIGPLMVLFSIPILIALTLFNETTLRKHKGKRKKRTYLPAIAEVEGGGIKRGLTAPEAAIILEMPLNKVLTLVIFGLLEKGLLEQEQADPLQVKVAEDFKVMDQSDLDTIKERRAYRQNVAQRKGTVVHSYEDRFLDLIEQHSDKPVQEIDFSKPMEWLIKIAAAKMKGFDLSDTQDYYRRVMDRAMKQASSIGEIEQREKYLDKYLPWVMMNEEYPTVMTHHGHHYWPIWARHAMRPATSSGGPSIGGGKSSSGGGRTTFGDVGASFAGWAESTMGGMAAAILPGSLQAPQVKGGVVDLSGVDKVTGDVFTALMESSKSGDSGGGSGCACACAGCACACACAGGGR
ncbi:MAG: hypothetical protein ACLFTI_00200 [Anaerolineales bacterium]